jgi:hypothetical protein
LWIDFDGFIVFALEAEESKAFIVSARKQYVLTLNGIFGKKLLGKREMDSCGLSASATCGTLFALALVR